MNSSVEAPVGIEMTVALRSVVALSSALVSEVAAVMATRVSLG